MNVSGVNSSGATSGSTDTSALEAQLKVLQNSLKNLQKRAANGEDVSKEIQSQNTKIEQLKQRISQTQQKSSSGGQSSTTDVKQEGKAKQIKELSRAMESGGTEEVEEAEEGKAAVTAFQNRRKLTDPNRLLDQYA